MDTKSSPPRIACLSDRPSRLMVWLGTVLLIATLACLIHATSASGDAEVASKGPRSDRHDRSWTAYMVFFGLLFGGGLACGINHACHYLLQNRKHRAAKARHPDEPWFWRSDWCALRVANRLDTLRALGLAWLAGMIVATARFFAMTFDMWNRPGLDLYELMIFAVWYLFWLVPFYPIGIWILLPGLRRWRFGASELVLPGTAGPDMRRLEAIVRVPSPGVGRMEFDVTLAQVERFEHQNSEGGKGIKENEVRTFTCEHSCVADGRLLQIPIRFALSTDCDSTTSMMSSEVGRAWKVQVFSKRRWFDYRAEFEVPVFRRAPASNTITPKTALTMNHPRKFSPARTDTLAATTIKTSTTPGGTPKPKDLRARSGKWLGMLVMAVIVGGLLLAAVSIAIQIAAGMAEDAAKGDWGLAACRMFYGLLFAGFPVCIALKIVADRRETREEPAIKLAHPDEPWFWRGDWRTLMVSNRHDTLEIIGLVWLTLLALAFGGMIVGEGMRWSSQSGWERLGAVAWFVLHSGILFALGNSTLVPALSRGRFGRSTLMLHHPGGPDLQRFEATVRVPSPGPGRVEFRVTLRAFERTQQPGAEGPVIAEVEVFSRSLTHCWDGSRGALEFSVAFDLPEGCGSTTSFEVNTVGRVWKLDVQAERPWFDYRAEFEVPVFRCAKSNVATVSQHN